MLAKRSSLSSSPRKRARTDRSRKETNMGTSRCSRADSIDANCTRK